MLQPDLSRPVYAALPKVGAIGYASVADIDRYAKTMTIGPHLLGVRDVALWTTDQMRAFADATHTLRTQQPALAASEWDVRGHLAALLTCWHRLTEREADELVAMFQGRQAPAAQQPAPSAAAAADPMNWPLPCDVTVGHGTMCKGVSLRTLVARMKVLYEMATGNNADEVAARTPEQRAALFEAFREKVGAAPEPSPTAQSAESVPAMVEDRDDFAWLVVQEACETEPADEDDPECIRILRRDLKSAVLAAFIRNTTARAPAQSVQRDAPPTIKGACITGGYVVVTPAGRGGGKAAVLRDAILRTFPVNPAFSPKPDDAAPAAKGGA